MASILVTGCTTPSLPVSSHQPRSIGEHFVNDLHRQTHELLYAAGCLSPDTREENQREIKQRRLRQAELEDWFQRAGRPASLTECHTEEDRKSFRSYPAAMTTAAFLQLNRSQRLAFIDDIDRYFLRMQLHLDSSFLYLCGEDQQLQHYLQERCLQVPAVRLRYFGQGNTTTVGAIYHPGTKTIYLNLHVLVDQPAVFIDSLEHEIWHHLLPTVEIKRFGDRPWVEGYIEAVSEIWSEHLGAQTPTAGHSIEYPFQTALASLHFAFARIPTMRYLAGLDTPASFRRALAKTPLALALPHFAPELPPATPSLEPWLCHILQAWGWQEDDGSPLDLHRLFTNNALQPEALSKEFQQDGAFVMDLMRAITIYKFQQAGSGLPRLDQTDLPDHLRHNLQAVLDNIHKPEDYYH